MPRTASRSGSRPIRLQKASSRRSEGRWRRTQPHGRAPLPLPSSYSPDARGSRNIWRQSSLPASVLNTRSSAERAARSPAPSSKRFTSMSASSVPVRVDSDVKKEAAHRQAFRLRPALRSTRLLPADDPENKIPLLLSAPEPNEESLAVIKETEEMIKPGTKEAITPCMTFSKRHSHDESPGGSIHIGIQPRPQKEGGKTRMESAQL